MTVSAYRLAGMFLNVLTVIAHWEEVFDAFGDMRNERKWNLGVQLMEKITDGPVRFGTKFRPKGADQPLIVECTKYERPQSRTYHNGE